MWLAQDYITLMLLVLHSPVLLHFQKVILKSAVLVSFYLILFPNPFYVCIDKVTVKVIFFTFSIHGLSLCLPHTTT